MPEELRVFVRAAAYIGLVTAIYWFVSHESAGTLLLGALFAAAILFVIVGRAFGRRTDARRRLVDVVAFTDEGDGPPPLEIEEEPVVTTSPWPLIGAGAALLIGLGLLYGPWLWIPGAGLALSVFYGWITQTDV